MASRSRLKVPGYDGGQVPRGKAFGYLFDKVNENLGNAGHAPLGDAPTTFQSNNKWVQKVEDQLLNPALYEATAKANAASAAVQQSVFEARRKMWERDAARIQREQARKAQQARAEFGRLYDKAKHQREILEREAARKFGKRDAKIDEALQQARAEEDRWRRLIMPSPTKFGPRQPAEDAPPTDFETSASFDRLVRSGAIRGYSTEDWDPGSGNQQGVIGPNGRPIIIGGKRLTNGALPDVQEIKKRRSFGDRVLGKLASDPVLRLAGKGLTALGVPQEEAAQPFYAGQHAMLRGAGAGEQLQASLLGIPGLGRFAHGNVKRDIEATNSREERARLTQEGRLASFGELTSGRYHHTLRPELRKYVHGFPEFLPDSSSGWLDAAFQVGSDPFTYVGGALAEAAKPGEHGLNAAYRKMAQEAGLGWKFRLSGKAARLEMGTIADNEARLIRQGRLANNKSLNRVMDEGVAILERGDARDAKGLARRMKGLRLQDAQRIVDAYDGGKGLGRNAFEEAFLSGRYGPTIRFRKAALINATDGRLGMGGLLGPTRGRRSVIAAADRLANPATRGTARTISKGADSGRIAYDALRDTVQRGELGSVSDAWSKLVGNPHGQTFNSRMARVIDFVDQGGGGVEFADFAEREAARITKVLRSGNRDEAEQALRTLEAVTAIASGQAGPENAQEILTQLRGLTPARTNTAYGLATEAARRTGFMGRAPKTASPGDWEDNLGQRGLFNPDGRPFLGRPIRTSQGRLEGAWDDLSSKVGSRRTPGPDPADTFADAPWEQTARGADNAAQGQLDLFGEGAAAPGDPEQLPFRFRDPSQDTFKRGGRFNPEHDPNVFSTEWGVDDVPGPYRELKWQQGEWNEVAANREALGEWDRAELEHIRGRLNASESVHGRSLMSGASDELAPINLDYFKKYPELADEFPKSFKASIKNFVEESGVRQRTPGKLQYKPNNRNTYQDVLRRVLRELPDGSGVREVFVDELRLAGGDAKKLAGLHNALDKLSQDGVLEKAVELLIRDKDLGLARSTVTTGVRQRPNPFRPFARLLLAITTPAPPTAIPFDRFPNKFVSIGHRVEGFDRWMSSPIVGFDATTRSQFRRQMEKAVSEKEVYEIERRAIRVYAERTGLDPKELLEELASKRVTLAEKSGFSVDPTTDELVKKPHNIRQAIQETPLLDPNRLARARRAQQGGALGKARNASGEFFNDSLIGRGYKRAHKGMKNLVVTNMYAPFLGAAVGAAANPDDRLKGALEGAAIGVLGPARYVLRVPILEERMRILLDQGLNPKVWIPAVAKFTAEQGELRGYHSLSGAAVKSGSDGVVAGEHIRHRLLSTIGDTGFEVIGRKEPGFIENWYRAVNLQIDPLTDIADELAIAAKAGRFSPETARARFKDFLQTEDGKIWQRRMRGIGAKNADDMWNRVYSLVDRVMPDPRIAAARLEGKIDWGELKSYLSKDLDYMVPDAIHGQRIWKMPKNFKELNQTVRGGLTKWRSAIMEKPTNLLNRGPLFEATYQKEFNRLRSAGVSAPDAQQLADEVAVERTNRILFNINDESRFARKVDYIFPFQQPREEVFSVWPRLVAENPARAAQVTRLAALAFNNGRDMGIFRKDDRGDWVFTIPGSASLAKSLYNLPFGFDARLRDILFVGQGAFGVGFVPTFGGPLWSVAGRAWVNAFPEAYNNMNPDLKEWLFSYGPGGNFTRPELRRLMMGLTGRPAPWDFMTQQEQENELNKARIDIVRAMMYQHGTKTGDYDWLPDEEDVEKMLKDFMKYRAFVGSVFPASPHPISPSKREFDLVAKAYKLPDGSLDFIALQKDHPVFVPYLIGGTKWVGPDDDIEDWKRKSQWDDDDIGIHYRKYKGLRDWSQDFKENREDAKVYAQRSAAFANPDPAARELLIKKWVLDHPDYAEKVRQAEFRDQELRDILINYPKGQLQDAALNRWRKHYDVKYGTFENLRHEVLSDDRRPTPWATARYEEDVFASVLEAEKRGLVNRKDPRSELTYVQGLNPAEQVRYWQYQIHLMNDRSFSPSDNPDDILNEYKRYKKNISDAFARNPELARRTPYKNNTDILMQQWEGNQREQINLAYTHLYDLVDRTKLAYAKKDWVSYKKLKAARDAASDTVRNLKDAYYRTLPTFQYPLEAAINDVRDVFITGSEKGAWKFKMESLNGKVDPNAIDFVPSNEEAYFLDMPDSVKKAFIQDLVNSVSSEPFTKGHIQYDWLSNFQKDLLDSNAPDVVDYSRSLLGLQDGKSGSAYKKYYKRRGGRTFGGLAIGEGGGEIAFAMEMFKQYNQRGERRAPAAYAAYQALPDNPVVRRAFLGQHPEVAEWIKLGPMANMPDLYRLMVTNIMIKYGRWEGETKEVGEITDLAFAREQLKRWNRRAGDKPQTYDLWLNMPTGPAKAQFLRSHPEIQNWIRLGPMQNMPEEYQAVVRDIMQKYGEWTDNQDPLGLVVQGYYSTPAYARDKYLQDHPELTEYWNALKSPEELAISNLADQYFSIPDAGAKKAFLQVHPDLQQFFLTQRTRRYEKFLAQVAAYMGNNPDLFKSYLDRQEAILADMVTRFGAPPLMREVSRLTMTAQSAKKSAEGGRQRTSR